MSATPTNRLHGTGLTVWRGERCLFSELDFVVQAGELLHVRGANGSGKTSLMRVACGLGHADEGQVLWNDQPLHRCRDDFHSALAWVGHEDGLHDDLTTLENLAWGLGLKREARRNEIRDGLEQLGLGHTADVLAYALSAGQRRRLALARAVLGGAQAWVFDEPLANLDEQARIWCVAAIETHVADGGLVMMSSHQPVELGGGRVRILELEG